MAHDMIFMTQCMASLKPTIVMFAREFIRRHQRLSCDPNCLLSYSGATSLPAQRAIFGRLNVEPDLS